MNKEGEVKHEGPEEKTDWNEEFNARLRLIEDHLRLIRRVLYFIAVCTGVGTILACGFAFFLITSLLRSNC